MDENSVEIVSPCLLEKVDRKFIISGFASRLWTGQGCNSLNLELLDIDGQTIVGSSISINPKSAEEERIPFQDTIRIATLSIPFIKSGNGRIVIKLSPWGVSPSRSAFYLPIIIRDFFSEPDDISLNGKHLQVASVVEKHEEDLKSYSEELSDLLRLREKRFELSSSKFSQLYSKAEDEALLDDVFDILEYSHDEKLQRINEKYKEALEWSGGLCRGLAGRQNGFEFRVHSHDHDQHFHVIHKEKGIDARFSFPEISLINYKFSRNKISRVAEKNIKDFFKIYDNFNKLKSEFEKRASNRM